MLIAQLILFYPLSAGWYERKAEGWFWHEDRPSKKEAEKEEPIPKEMTAEEKLTEMRKELEESLAEAILNPTEDNIYAYMELQQIMTAKASKFSSVWRKMLLSHPELDETLKGRPVSRYGIQLYNKQRSDDLKKLISEFTISSQKK